jgi:dipeptidyl-peptidase-4
MSSIRFARPAVWAAAAAAVALTAPAQDRLKSMPGYDQYQKMVNQIPGSVKLGQINVTWREGGKAFDYPKDGKTYRYNLETKKSEEVKGDAAGGDPAGGRGGFGGRGGRGGGQGGGRGAGLERGRQATESTSPNGKLRAYYKDRNLWLNDSDAGVDMPLTLDGSEAKRIKYGTASWVYGEELRQTSAIWWSPDSKYLAYYRFDESKVIDYYLQMDQTKVQSKIDTEPYPKAGTPNPIVDLFVYDVAAKKSTKVDVRDGQPFENATVGYYVYQITWSPGKTPELLFNRTNRRQNILEFCAVDPVTGKCRVIVREEWPTGWVDNHPPIRYLADNHRFLWTSERTGFKNFYLYDLSGKLHATVTAHPFEVAQIVRVDEEKNLLYYMARSGDNHMMMQLHRCTLDGKDDKRLTDPALNHGVNLSPDGKYFIDVAQTHDVPPVTRLVGEDGKVIEELAKSDTSKFDQLKLNKVELITYKAGDGTTDLHGFLHKPSNFDPNKKYPMLVSVYAGPNTNAARETFTLPSTMTEYGFLVASFDSRSATGRGKKFIDAIYEKLGVTEIDDQAAGVRSLWDRPYVDKNRVGIYGTSYGGYASCLCLLRHPDAFQAACASSSVTDYRHYDTIYTERYMWIPQENKKGYDAGSAMTYAKNLKGRLMLYYGTADNNVHPNNTMQLIAALQRENKNFEVQVGPDRGHTAVNQARMMEFFIEALGSPKPATTEAK